MSLRRQPPVKWLLLAAVVVVALVLSACGENLPATTTYPEGTHARRIYELLVPIFWVALGVFVVVEGLLIYSVVRFRRRPNSGVPTQIHGNTTIEIAWTIAPALILLVIAVLTFRTQAIQSIQPPNAMKIQVTGHQWWWEFRYAGQNVVTAGDMYVPVGQDITLELMSKDVIHSFWMPKLAGKTDAIPGHTNLLSFQAEQPGIYHGLCAEFCGEQHAVMRFRVVVVPPDVFQSWVQQQTTAPPPPPENVKQIFIQKGCVGCHSINGFQEAVGQVGPNLTYFGSRETIAGGALPNTPDNLRLWLHDPGAVKSGNTMATTIGPGKVMLTPDEINALVAYLEGMTIPIAKPAAR
ncbi:MAG: cytochrome c oxidase subunit II [Roseiflexaceae bacterium]